MNTLLNISPSSTIGRTHTLDTSAAGFPFNRGQWVASTLKSPECQQVDTVELSSKSVQSAPAQTCGGTVKVASGDTLSQLLLQRGYSLEEMLKKDENGQNMFDTIAATNGLRNPNLIHPGQELTLPSKEEAGMEVEATEEESFDQEDGLCECSCSDTFEEAAFPSFFTSLFPSFVNFFQNQLMSQEESDESWDQDFSEGSDWYDESSDAVFAEYVH